MTAWAWSSIHGAWKIHKALLIITVAEQVVRASSFSIQFNLSLKELSYKFYNFLYVKVLTQYCQFVFFLKKE